MDKVINSIKQQINILQDEIESLNCDAKYSYKLNFHIENEIIHKILDERASFRNFLRDTLVALEKVINDKTTV